MKQSTQDHSDQAPETKPERAAPEQKSPQAWAEHLGQIGRLRVPNGERYFRDYRHGMAVVIHGWSLHEYHEGAAPQLALADYEAALKAAESFPYKPHKSALTKYAPAEYRRVAR